MTRAVGADEIGRIAHLVAPEVAATIGLPEKYIAGQISENKLIDGERLVLSALVAADMKCEAACRKAAETYDAGGEPQPAVSMLECIAVRAVLCYLRREMRSAAAWLHDAESIEARMVTQQ